MKIKTKPMDYAEVMKIKKPKHKNPLKPPLLFRFLMKIAGMPELKEVGFSCEYDNKEYFNDRSPALFLMNHSGFIDLEIASGILFPRPFNIVCTSDGFVGKELLMRLLGCIPTEKFITDVTLVRDMLYSVNKLKCSVLMYPEASYSFDGTATTLPEGLGKCVKLLKVPVFMIKTEGAFGRDPLYNMLQKRKVKVKARVTRLFSKEEIAEKSEAEIKAVLKESFTFDNFRFQRENRIKISEAFRADGLNRVLYKCPACNSEGKMSGKGTELVCESCKKKWELTEYGALKAADGEDIFDHIPTWYEWERKCVRDELLSGSYRLDIPVDIKMLVDSKYIYEIGEGRLVHSSGGFELTGAEGKPEYRHAPLRSYSLYSDYYWYEIGDVICIGDKKALYYCFPKNCGDVVAKTRLAAEELYKIKKGI